ncbi:MAG: hypothetical protein LC107_00050 [Chitinophagales bacterium]|nr:hypothetical protein [Chitinophagales bacterium]
MSRFKIIFFLLAFFMAFVGHDAQAQLRKNTNVSSKSKKESKEKGDTKSFLENLGGEILLGNVGFYNGLSLSSKLSVGYKLGERVALGGGLKLFYDQYSVVGPDPSIFDYGGLFMGRVKLFQDFYLKAEYSFMNYAKDPVGYGYIFRGLYEDLSVNYPSFGLGYSSGTDQWKVGVELLFIANETAKDIQNAVLEYWFGAVYNF